MTPLEKYFFQDNLISNKYKSSSSHPMLPLLPSQQAGTQVGSLRAFQDSFLFLILIPKTKGHVLYYFLDYSQSDSLSPFLLPLFRPPSSPI